MDVVYHSKDFPDIPTDATWHVQLNVVRGRRARSDGHIRGNVMASATDVRMSAAGVAQRGDIRPASWW
jgi:hypothetical protein